MIQAPTAIGRNEELSQERMCSEMFSVSARFLRDLDSKSSPHALRRSIDFMNENSYLLTDAVRSGNAELFDNSMDTLSNFLRHIDTIYIFSETASESGLSNDIYKFVDFGLTLIGDSLPEIEKRLNIADLSQKDRLMETVNFYSRVSFKMGRKDDQRKGIDFLLRHFEDIAKEKYFRGEGSFARITGLSTILEYGNNSQKELCRETIVRLLKEPYGIRRIVAYNIPILFSEEILSSFGIDGGQALRAWKAAPFGKEDPERKSFSENLLALLKLESQRPGIGKVLQSEFGINDFARYPKEFLVAQYDSRNDIKSPYGVVINAEFDDEGSFYNDRQVYGKLLARISGNYRIRAYEVKDLLGLIRAINKSRHRYGKISFAIIGGHGEKESIRLGVSVYDSNQKREELSISDIRRKGAYSIIRGFIESEDPRIILNACSTGEFGGLGQEISKIGGKVIAPGEDIYYCNINVTNSPDGSLNFQVYYDGDPNIPPQIYKSGMLISNFDKTE